VVRGKCSMSNVNVTVFMRFLINCMLNVQHKNVPERFLDTFSEKCFFEILFEGMSAYVVVIQAA